MDSTSPSAELTSAPAEPAMVADDSGSIWVSGKNVVIRMDAGTRQISDVIEVGSGGQLLDGRIILVMGGPVPCVSANEVSFCAFR